MNSFLYKSDSKELWLVMTEPQRDVNYFAALSFDQEIEADRKIAEWENRLHYTVSPELHELLKDRKDEIMENEFLVVDDYDPVHDGLTDYGGPPVKWGKIAIPLPEQTKPVKVRYKCPMCRHWWREKRDHNCLGGYIKMDHVEWETIYPDNNAKQSTMKDSQTNQEAGKQSAEQVVDLLETVKIALFYRDFGVLNEYLESIGEKKIEAPTPPTAATLVKGDGMKIIEWINKNIEASFRDLAWEAGARSAYDCVRPEGPCGFDEKQHELNKIDFFKTHEHQPKAAPKGDDVKSPEEILHKHTGGRDYTIPTLKLAILEYANQLAAPQAVKWVQAIELIHRLSELAPYHISPYNLGEEGEIFTLIRKLEELTGESGKIKMETK